MTFLTNNEFCTIEVDLEDHESRPPLYIALDTWHVNDEDDAAVQLIVAECSIDVTILQRILYYSMKNDVIGVPALMIKQDLEDPSRPFLW